MKVELKAGASIDVLNADELEERMRPMFDRLVEAQADAEGTPFDIPGAKINVPVSGHIGETKLYSVPTGFTATIHRISFAADGYTPGAPLAPSGGWLALWRNTASPYNLLYPFPSGNTALAPVVVTEGNKQAADLRNGEVLVLTGELGTLAAITGLYVSIHVMLKRTHRGISRA